MKKSKIVSKILLLIIVFCLIISLVACGVVEDITQGELVSEMFLRVGRSLFNNSEILNDVNVFFFDDDNLVSKDGKTYERTAQKGIKSSDCYMIQSGDCEILVDGGYQTGGSSSAIIENYKSNLSKKIATVMSADGVLDYLIVTHADFDHIATLVYGIFDAFLNNETVIDLNGREVTFDKINYIIDFDSGLVRHYSDKELATARRLVDSETYQLYVTKRNRLINEKGTNYCPAATFFEGSQPDSLDVKVIPDAVTELVNGAINSSTSSNKDRRYYILDESKQDNDEVNKVALKNADFAGSELLNSENGELVATKDNPERFYYKLKFNNGELRILYNWYYNYMFRSSFKSQDRNNISVCFEVVKGNFKFLSLGDLGGSGENGLLKYYADTDVLSDVSLFKASHHGSTYNGENSKELFKITKPRVIVITGCAWHKPNQDDMVDPFIKSVPQIEQKFFENVRNAFSDKESLPYILCTNINSYRYSNGVDIFESAPFYGDVRVTYNGLQLLLSYSYVGEINAYISQSQQGDIDAKMCSFKTRKWGKFISFEKTKWFEDIGFKYEQDSTK